MGTFANCTHRVCIFNMVVSYQRVEARQCHGIVRQYIIEIHAFQVSESVGEALASFVRNYFKPMKDNKGYFTKCSSELDNALYKNASVSKWVEDYNYMSLLFIVHCNTTIRLTNPLNGAMWYVFFLILGPNPMILTKPYVNLTMQEKTLVGRL